MYSYFKLSEDVTGRQDYKAKFFWLFNLVYLTISWFQFFQTDSPPLFFWPVLKFIPRISPGPFLKKMFGPVPIGPWDFFFLVWPSSTPEL